jgi:nucleotide-binding universal stress UspA family protein
MSDNVLVAFDGSPLSERALRYALETLRWGISSTHLARPA